MKYFGFAFLLGVSVLFSCEQTNKIGTDNQQLSQADSVELGQMIDTLVAHYSDNNDTLLGQSNAIVTRFDFRKAEISSKIAFTHYGQANYFLAEYYFKQAADYYLLDSLHEKHAEQLANLGVVKEVSGSYTEATEIYFQALQIFDSLGVELKKAMILNNLGIVYQQLKEHQKALDYYKQSLHITQKLGQTAISAKRYNNIASVFEEMKFSPDSSLRYYNKAYDIWKSDSTNQYLPIVENNIGYIYLLKKDYKTADSLFRRAYDFCMRYDQKNRLPQIIRNQALLQLRTGKIHAAIIKANYAVELARKSANKEIENESLTVLIEALEKNGNFREANTKLKQSFALQDEFRGEEQLKEINRMNIQYQVREKEHDIEILKLETSVQNKQITQQWLFIAVLILLLAALLMFYYLYRKNSELKLADMRDDIRDYLAQIEEIKDQNIQKLDQDVLTKIKQFQLSEREEQVLFWISKGYKNAEIAEKMFVSVNTIKTHTKNIFMKLDVRNRTEAAHKVR